MEEVETSCFHRDGIVDGSRTAVIQRCRVGCLLPGEVVVGRRSGRPAPLTGQLEEVAIFVAPVVTVSALQYAQPVANEQQHASWRAWMGTLFFQRSLPRGTQSESVYDHLEKRACRFLCR